MWIHDRIKLAERDSNGFVRWETPVGSYWTSESRSALEYDLAEQARKIYGTGEKGPRSGDVVLDCGANVGIFARVALAAGARLVVAIEPGPENLECLRRNLAKEIAKGQVIVYPKGVWNKEDVLTLYSDPKNSAPDSLLELNGPWITQVQVPLTTIDRLVNELGLDRVDFIKMDIEGAETKAVLGARETLKKFKPRMALCLYHLKTDPIEVPKAVRAIVPEYRFLVQGCMFKNGIVPEVGHFLIP